MKKTNKILAIILAILMVVSIIPITASADDLITSGTCGDNLTWNINMETWTLTISGTGEMSDYKSNNRPWEEFAKNVKTVVIADGVTTIGKNAFKKLTKLIHVEIGNDVTTIGEFAFNGCYTIDTVIIGSDVTQICDSAFSACNSLNYIYYMGTETEYNKVDWYEINEEEYDAIWFRVRYIFIEDIETDSGKCGGNLTWTYDVPACTLTISGTGDMDDYNYDKMPPWYQWRFFIKNVVMEEGITKIGELSFNGCDKLETAIIPDGVKIINNGAFNTCYSLKAITIPDSVTTINYGAFSSCSSIISVAMGSGVASIGEYAFAGCDSVIEYTVDNDNQYFSTDEYGVLFNKDKTFLIQYTNGNTRTAYSIPDTVISIGYMSFNNAKNLTDVTFGKSVTTIDKAAFERCSNLSSVTIPKSLTSVDFAAFDECFNIKNVYYWGTENEWYNMNVSRYNEPLLNATIHFLGEEFHECSYNAVVTPPTCKEQGYTTYTCDCGNTYVDDYVGALGHIDNDNNNCCDKCSKYILPTSGTYGDNVTWTFDESTGTLTFSGTGEMQYATSHGVPWHGHINSIERVVISEGVTTIGDKVFYNHKNIKNVSIADSVTAIDDEAFYNCTGLTDVVIGKGVTTIGDKAFYECSNLKTVTIYNAVEEIGKYSFSNCSKLTDVYYLGTEAEWNAITKATILSKTGLEKATIHFLGEETHECSYNAVVTPPTCTEQGYTTYTCECGDSYVDDYVNATGHNHSSEITTPATHTTTGVMTYTCTCGDTYTETIDKLAEHNYETVITAPTCTDNGYTTFTCECGDSYVDDYVDALGHDFNNGFCTNMDCAQLESASYTTNKYDIDGDTDLDAVYEISNAGQLYWFAEQVNEGNSNINAILLNDIVVNSGDLKNYDGTSANNWKVWSAIGVKRSFQGIFDGNGYCISGLYMNDDTTSGFGLFYALDGEIRNLGIVNSYFSGKNTVGGICAEISDYKAKVIGCYSDATIFVSNGCAGGICAGSYGIIEKCYNTGSITSSDEMYIGGIVGYNLNSGRIKECYNTGTINGYKFVAGICGYDEGDEISNCYNEGAITGYMHIAGICGLNTAKVSKCYNLGTITGYEKVAGICGENTNVISNCYNVGDINGYVVYIGGICGVVLPDRTIEYCHNVGKVVGTGEGISCNVGAICGGGANASVKFCYYQENCVIDGKGIVQNGMGHHDVGTRPDIVGSTMCMSVEQFASGEICIALNGEKAGDETAIWKQNIGEYGYPTFNGKTVFCDCSKENYTNASQESYHNYKSTVAKEPTCSETGVMTYTCSCGDTYTEVIDKLAEHNYQAVITSPSCTEQGYTTYTCACGDSYVSDYVDALGHNPATAVEENYVAPTCTENGSKDVVVYCSVCEEEISRETVILEATNHADNDDDGYCDACTELLDPTVECDCYCHNNGLANFLWKIINFFNKLFGLNKLCECGVSHY